jgi:hypothetical protein
MLQLNRVMMIKLIRKSAAGAHLLNFRTEIPSYAPRVFLAAIVLYWVAEGSDLSPHASVACPFARHPARPSFALKPVCGEYGRTGAVPADPASNGRDIRCTGH